MRIFRSRVLALVALAVMLTPLAGLNGSVSLADHLLSSGIVVPLRMNSTLSSEISRVGQTWSATVTQDVFDGNQLVIPRGATVEGYVTNVRDADRFNRSGTLGIEFQRIIFPNGQRVENINAMLTSLDPSIRAQLDEESRLRGGGSSFKRNVFFIGGGAGAGALIGAIADGGSGAGIGAGVGALAGLVLSALNRGSEVTVPAGTEFGMQLVAPLTVPVVFGDRFDRDTGFTTSTTTVTTTQFDLDSRDTILQAQQRLRQLGYYRGPINGVLTSSTRQAILSFQEAYNLYETGRLDNRTAERLGLDVVTVSDRNINFNSRLAITQAQQRLRQLGYYRGPINGALTFTTRRAIQSFQNDNNLSETGRLDFRTADQLDLEIVNVSDPVDNRFDDLDPNGQPTFMGVGSTHRFIIWRDGNRWNIRTTTAGQQHNFEGRVIASNGSIRAVTRVGLEPESFDRLGLDSSRRQLNFDFTTAGHMDGVNFFTDADTLTFHLWMDGRLTPHNVYIGRNGTNPVSIPFTVANE